MLPGRPRAGADSGPRPRSPSRAHLPRWRRPRLEPGAGWAGRGLLFLSGERSPLGEAGQGAPAPPYSLPLAGPRRAATMSTAAFHISSLLEKMTSSDKDFRCDPRPGPPFRLHRNPQPSSPPVEPAQPQDPAAAASSPRVKHRPLSAPPPRTPPRLNAPKGALAPHLPRLQPFAPPNSNPCFVSCRANFCPCLLSPLKAPAPSLCTLPLSLLSSFMTSPCLAPHLMRRQ